MEFKEPKIVALVASYPRMDLLLSRSLPSIRAQTRLPDALVIVADRQELSCEEKRKILAMFSHVSVVFLCNEGIPGVSDTWNTGLDYIAKRWPDSFVAILDDDDEWTEPHIHDCNVLTMDTSLSDVVVSGIQVYFKGRVIESIPPTSFCVEDFLHTNPGWQGSNTFAKTSVLIRAGKFRSNLVSTNDRDLAIRILDLPAIRLGFTNKLTVIWWGGEREESLSFRGSEKKLKGLAMFYRLYRGRMNQTIEDKFFQRCNDIFGFTPSQIRNLEISDT